MRRPLPDLGLHERQLLVNCARLTLDESLAHATEALLQEPLAWEAVLSHAELHSVAPLLYHHLKRLQHLQRLPPEARRRLLQLFHRTGYQNRRFAKALHDLLEAFSEAGIPLLVLKGLSLVELIYGNLSLRPLIDLNCLVPPDERSAAKDLLYQMGYVEVIRPAFRGVYQRFNSQFLMVRAGDFKVYFLMQWDVVNWPRIHNFDLERFWADAQPARLAGCEALVPSPTNSVLYLGGQPDKHGFLNLPALVAESPEEFIFKSWTHNRLIRFTDIYEVIRHYQAVLDWKVLVERAQASGVADSLYASLSWTRKLYGPVFEPWVLDALRRPSPRRLRRWLYDALAQEPGGGGLSETGSNIGRAVWSKLRVKSQVRLIRILDILEFTFPRRQELKGRHIPNSGHTTLAQYLIHVGNWLALCFVGFLLYIYCLIVPRRPLVEGSSEPTGRGVGS
jgi:hypothetical protein